MRPVVIIDAGVGHRADLTIIIEEGMVTRISARRDVPTGARMIDARGGAALPGLWDHHVHLFASAARRRSVDVSGIRDIDEFALHVGRYVREPATDGWLRVVGYDDVRLGVLTARRLDRLVPTDMPIRVQHRGGHQWVLNHAAAARLTIDARLEVDTDGILSDADELIRDIPGARPSNAELREQMLRLTRQGCVGATDMTVANDSATAALLRTISGEALGLEVFGAPVNDSQARSGSKQLDGAKIVVAEHSLPSPDELAARIDSSRPQPVAVHAVTAEALALVAWALPSRAQEGDRVEHAFLADPALIRRFSSTPVAVGANPGFIRSHGDRVRKMLAAADIDDYQPLAGWHRAGIRLLGGTDAPFATPSVWSAMQSAATRTTASGHQLNPSEALSPEDAFAMFTSGGLRAESAVPQLREGHRADICVIDRPWETARTRLDEVRVRATLRAGRPTWSDRAER